MKAILQHIFHEIGKIECDLEISPQRKNAMLLHQHVPDGGMLFDPFMDITAEFLGSRQGALDPGDLFQDHATGDRHQGKRSLHIGISGCIGRMEVSHSPHIRTKLIHNEVEEFL
jgi:hypothetical protein